MQGVIGRVHIQHDLLRGLDVAFREQVHQQGDQPLGVCHDPFVAMLARLLGGVQLEPIEGAGTDQWMAPVTLSTAALTQQVLAGHGQREPEEALGEEAAEGMIAATTIPVIGETGGQAPGEVEAAVDGAQQQAAAVGGHAAVIEAGTHLAAAMLGQIDCVTLCRHEESPWVESNPLITNSLPQEHTPCLPPAVSSPG